MRAPAPLASRACDRLTVVYPLDPLGSKVGGSVTFIRGFVQHAPSDLELRFVGLTSDTSRHPARRWTRATLGARSFEFYPLFHEADEDRRRTVPLSLRFVLRLARDPLPDDGSVLVHNRIETTLARGARNHRNVVFVHNDLARQINGGPSEMLWSRFPGLYFATERHITRFVDQVYTVSTRTLDGWQRRYGSDRAKFGFVPTWVDRGVFAAAPMPKRLLRAALVQDGIRLDPDAPWVLYAGRLQPQKAPERLIEAFAALRQSHPEARLLVAGEGNLRAAVEDRIRRLRLEGAVQLLGALPQAELVRYYQASDAYVLVSDYEGMPMGVLEALACALPVVTTDVGEVRRVVAPGLTGEICGNSPREIARALARVLEAPQRYARAACVEAVAPYSAERVLAPLYARIRLLARGSRDEHER